MQSSGNINNTMLWWPRKPHGKNLGRIWPSYPQGKPESTMKESMFYNRAYTTNILLLPTSRNLLTRPRASSKTTDSFFLGFSSKYKHTRLCFFKFFSATTEWSSSSWTNLLLIILSSCKRKLLTDLTRDSHKPQYEQPLKPGYGLPYILGAKI